MSHEGSIENNATSAQVCHSLQSNPLAFDVMQDLQHRIKERLKCPQRPTSFNLFEDSVEAESPVVYVGCDGPGTRNYVYGLFPRKDGFDYLFHSTVDSTGLEVAEPPHFLPLHKGGRIPVMRSPCYPLFDKIFGRCGDQKCAQTAGFHIGAACARSRHHQKPDPLCEHCGNEIRWGLWGKVGDTEI